MSKKNDFMDINGIENIAEYIKSPRKFIENFCYITTKKATFELLKLNKPQSIVMDYVEECLEKGVPIRVRILKARQMGFSTLISALGFWWATMNEYSSYAVVAHKEDATRSIFDKNRIFFENLPKALRPKTNRFNSETISYDYVGEDPNSGGLKSRIFFGTAGGSELFRGETILFMHKSEKAFWENVEILNKSLNACVPQLPFTAIFDESTANGYNHYKDEWDASVKGINDYKPFFFGWNMMDEYQMEVEEGFEFLDIEEEYMLVNDLTREQMRWRRAKLVNDFGYDLVDIANDDIDDFKQEYPLAPEEAFVSSGKSVFPSKVIAKGLEWSRKNRPIATYDITSVPLKEKLEVYSEPEREEILEYDKVVEFDEEQQKYVYVETDLLLGKKYRYANYLISIDTSGSGQDNNYISVWHTYHKRKVAHWKRKTISEEDLAKVAVEIARYYNNAIIAPETNYSHSLVGFIEDLGYTNLYIGESFTRIDKKKETMEYGWKTTSVTKPLLVSSMKKALNDDYTICPDLDFWEEAEYYIQSKSPSGKDIYNAASGHHDDNVMGSMIGRFLCDSIMVNQNYTISKKEIIFDNKQKNKIGGIIVTKDKNWLPGYQSKKSTKKFEKGVFRNNA